MTKILATELPLLTTFTQMGSDTIKELQEEGFDGDPVQQFADDYMENLSEAGYSEARPNGRLSTRALASIIRVKRQDLKAVRRLIGYRRGNYHDFAMADIIVQSLSLWEPTAAAAALLKAPQTVQWKGPFYPSCKTLSLKTDSNWAFHCLLMGKRSPELQQSMATLAGLFSVDEGQLEEIGKRLASSVDTPAELQHRLHEVVIESARTCPRFRYALG